MRLAHNRPIHVPRHYADRPLARGIPPAAKAPHLGGKPLPRWGWAPARNGRILATVVGRTPCAPLLRKSGCAGVGVGTSCTSAQSVVGQGRSGSHPGRPALFRASGRYGCANLCYRKHYNPSSTRESGPAAAPGVAGSCCPWGNKTALERPAGSRITPSRGLWWQSTTRRLVAGSAAPRAREVPLRSSAGGHG